MAAADQFLGMGPCVSEAVATGIIRPAGTDLDLLVGRGRVSYHQIAHLVNSMQLRGSQPRRVPGLALRD